MFYKLLCKKTAEKLKERGFVYVVEIVGNGTIVYNFIASAELVAAINGMKEEFGDGEVVGSGMESSSLRF